MDCKPHKPYKPHKPRKPQETHQIRKLHAFFTNQQTIIGRVKRRKKLRKMTQSPNKPFFFFHFLVTKTSPSCSICFSIWKRPSLVQTSPSFHTKVSSTRRALAVRGFLQRRFSWSSLWSSKAFLLNGKEQENDSRLIKALRWAFNYLRK